jgi:hypothetical protein
VHLNFSPDLCLAPDDGTNIAFAVDASLSPGFTTCYSIPENLRRRISWYQPDNANVDLKHDFQQTLGVLASARAIRTALAVVALPLAENSMQTKTKREY